MIIPNPDDEVTGVLCALDCTTKAIEEAKKRGFNVIVTHHPLIFKPLGSILPTDSVGKRVLDCIRNGIAVLSYHTRLDIIDGGVNDTLCSVLGIKNASAFIPYGRIGEVEETTFEAFSSFVAEKLGVCGLSLVKATEKVKRVALVSGCGKDEINAVISAGADTFVTGEVMHNHMIDCKELGLNLVCGTHYATERIVLPSLCEIVKSTGCEAQTFEFRREEEYGI
jgi:dinuclear metal center YbgI/SA1388 family protein